MKLKKIEEDLQFNERQGAERKRSNGENEYFVIKFRRSDLEEDEDDKQLIGLLEGKSEPFFGLPSILKWPRGERRNVERTLLILRAGIAHLKEKYPREASLKENYDEKKTEKNSHEKKNESHFNASDFHGW
jgi:hypothetical protein